MEYNYTIKKETLPEDMELELVIFTVITMILDKRISIDSFKTWLERSIKGDNDDNDNDDDNIIGSEKDDEVSFLKKTCPSYDIVINYILDCVQINLKHIIENKDSKEYFESTYESIRIYIKNKNITSPSTKSLQSNQTKTKSSKSKKSIPLNFVFSSSPYQQKRGGSRDKYSYNNNNNNNNNNRKQYHNDNNYNNNISPLSNKYNNNNRPLINLIEEDFPVLKKSPTPKKNNIKTELKKKDIEELLSNKNHIDILIQIYKIILELFPLRIDDINIFFKTLSCNIFSVDPISLRNNNGFNTTKVYEIKTQLDAIYFSCHILSFLLPLLKFMNQTDIEYLMNHSAFPVLFPDICKSLYDNLSSKNNNIFIKSSNISSNNKLSYTINGLIKVKGKNGTVENRREKVLLDIQNNPHSLLPIVNDLSDEDYEWFSSLLINLLLSTNNTIDHLDLTVEKRHSLNQRFGIHQAYHTSTKFDPKSYQPNTNDDFIHLFDSEEIHFYDLFKQFNEWRFMYHIKNKLYIILIKLIIEPIDNIRNIIEHIQQLKRISKFLALLNILPFIKFKSINEKLLFDDNKHIEVIEMIKLSKENGTMTLHIPWIVQYIKILSRCEVFRQSFYFKSILYHINETINDPIFNIYHPSFNINRFFVYHCLKSLLNENNDIISESSYNNNNHHHHYLSLNNFIKDNIKHQSKSNIDNTPDIIDDAFISTLFKYFDTIKMILRDLKPNDLSISSNQSFKLNQPMKKISPMQIGSSFDLDKEIEKWISYNNEFKRICLCIQRSVTNITIETFSHDIKSSILSSIESSSSYTSESIIHQWEEKLSSFFVDKIKESFDILIPHISENSKELLKIFTIQNTKQSINKYIKDTILSSISK